MPRQKPDISADFWQCRVLTHTQIQAQLGVNEKKFRGWCEGYLDYGRRRIPITPLRHFRDGDVILVRRRELLRFLEINERNHDPMERQGEGGPED